MTNSLSPLLGLTKKNLTTNTSDNKVEITQIQALLFHYSLVSKSSVTII